MGKGKGTGPAGIGEKRTKTSLTLGSLTCFMKGAPTMSGPHGWSSTHS